MNLENAPKTIVCDVDGTVLFDDRRRPLIPALGAEEYFQACLCDEPNWPLIVTLQMYRKQGFRIVMITGRSETIREKTMQTFKMYDVPCDALYMRNVGEYDPLGKTGKAFHPDAEVKARIVAENDINPDDVLMVFEDRVNMVEWWRSEGFTCWQVRDEGVMY